MSLNIDHSEAPPPFPSLERHWTFPTIFMAETAVHAQSNIYIFKYTHAASLGSTAQIVSAPVDSDSVCLKSSARVRAHVQPPACLHILD